MGGFATVRPIGPWLPDVSASAGGLGAGLVGLGIPIAMQLLANLIPGGWSPTMTPQEEYDWARDYFGEENLESLGITDPNAPPTEGQPGDFRGAEELPPENTWQPPEGVDPETGLPRYPVDATGAAPPPPPEIPPPPPPIIPPVLPPLVTTPPIPPPVEPVMPYPDAIGEDGTPIFRTTGTGRLSPPEPTAPLPPPMPPRVFTPPPVAPPPAVPPFEPPPEIPVIPPEDTLPLPPPEALPPPPANPPPPGGSGLPNIPPVGGGGGGGGGGGAPMPSTNYPVVGDNSMIQSLFSQQAYQPTYIPGLGFFLRGGR